jgi:asparagine synthase (glutamine-hydrolysing)
MYDFAGQFGLSHKHSLTEALSAMLDSPKNFYLGSHAALAAQSIGELGPVACSVSGHPRWLDAKLTEEAACEGDAAVFAKLWHETGRLALRYLGGGFALAVWDQERQAGLLAIDRMGICSLAYAELPGQLVFASDLQRLRRHPGISSAIDPQALFAYLYFHMIPAPLSVYRGIQKLLPGQYLTWQPSGIEAGFYWQPEFREDDRSEAELAQELRTRLKQAVAENLKPSQPTGAFLSGGLDSSTVVGLLKELAPESACAFSIGFAAQGYDEMEYARASARHFRVPLYEHYLTPEDIVEAVPKIAAAYDEPFGNASAIAAYCCARLAKEHGKTYLLAGDGGDELFAGNSRYARQKLLALYEQVPSWLRTRLIEPLARACGTWPGLAKLNRYIAQAKLPLPERLETYNFLHRTPLADIFEAEFLAGVQTDWPVKHLREIYFRPSASLLKRMLYLDWKITLADNDLRKVNRTCALAGVEVRYPMLHEKVVELAAQIPDRLLMRGLELRSFYRRAFKDFLAPKTLTKPKHGFGLPFGVWLKSNAKLQELTYTSLDHPALCGILRQDYLAKLKQTHLSEHPGYYGVMLYVLMMWAQWAEQH